MAAIGTIRKYSGVAVAAIGVSIFAFIISDAFRTDRKMFGNNDNSLGIIAGKSIEYQEFHNKVEIMVEKLKEQQGVENIDEKTRSQIRDQIWQNLIDEYVFEKEYKSAGLIVSAEELSYMVTGPDPHPSVKQAFTDPKTGIYDRNQLVNFLKNMDKDQKYKNMWIDFEENMVKEQLRQKYNNLIKGSLFVTDVEANDDYYGKNKFAGYQYVALQTKSIPDSTIKPTDKQLEKYWKEHAYLYEIEESRSIEYITFDITPTKDDTLELLNQMHIIAKEFSETLNDSSYVQVNSEIPFDTLFHPRNNYSQIIEDSIIAGKRPIIGPYFENNTFKIAKLVAEKNDTLFYYKASHIVIKPTGNTLMDTLQAMKKAMEIMADIRKGTDFSKKAMELSEDKRTAVNGGDLGWFKDGSMEKPVINAVKNARKGDMFVVKTMMGAEIIKVTGDKTNKIYKIGVIQKTIGPSSKTFNAIYFTANKFRSKISSIEEFNKVITESGMNKKIGNDIKPDALEITGLPDSRKLINWVYKAKKKDVSEVIELNNQFVIAVLTKANKKGTAPLEDVKAEVEKKVIVEIKLETLYEKLKTVREKNSDINKIATALKLNVENVTNSSFNVSFLANVGEEKYLTGYIFGSKPGKLSNVVKGDNGVFVFIVSQFSKVEPPKDLTNARKELLTNSQGMAQYFCTESVKENAKIQDYRYRFY